MKKNKTKSDSSKKRSSIAKPSKKRSKKNTQQTNGGIVTNKKLKDRIDIELSKTYFSRASEGNLKYSKKYLKKYWILPAGALTLVGLILTTTYFLNHKHTPYISGINTKDVKKTVPSASFAPPQNAPDFSPRGSTKHSGKILYDFERNDEGWEIPAWTLERPDYVAKFFKTTTDLASSGSGSLELYAEFSGGIWAAALIEIQQYLNLENYDTLSCDLYLSHDSPKGLKAKLILTVDENWRFVEMARSIRLKPGEWTTLTADISIGSTDWKRTKVDTIFKQDVRKISIRVESNKTYYFGPIYVDNIRVQ